MLSPLIVMSIVLALAAVLAQTPMDGWLLAKAIFASLAGACFAIVIGPLARRLWPQ